MSNKTILHFAFSPVQGFVSQARRTRDLWAGSYLLSWLAGRAMQTLVEKGGNVILPAIDDDPLFKQICSPNPDISFNDQASYLGSLPNRFTAVLPAGLDGNICSDAIHKGWKTITDAVYETVKRSFKQEQDDIWVRQTQNYWETTWVTGEKTYLLDQRKNMRLHFPPNEPREKCTVCGERQELSGNRSPQRKVMNHWWEYFKEKNSENIHGLDLKPGERLCAICLTKRLFPHVSEKAIGWKVPEFYPSTPYMAAIDWINMVFDVSQNDESVLNAAAVLLNSVQERIISEAERRTWAPIASIRQRVIDTPELRKFLTVDGNIFYQDAIAQKSLGLANAPEVSNALGALHKILKTKNLPAARASPFYAILVMDGDNMGTLIGNCSDKDKREKISQALGQFTRKVPKIVRENNGMLLYAGGDDVFALVPVSTAMECARLCKVAYQCAFKEYAPFVENTFATISAAIEYVHMHTALGVVVRDAHSLLDDIAKDKTGRNAIACRVWKRGGPVLTWSQPWDKVDDGALVREVQRAFSFTRDGVDSFSSRFFYKLDNLFELIESGTFAGADEEICDLLVVEYLANREHNWPEEMTKDEKRSQARNNVQDLLRLCRHTIRNLDEEGREEIVTTGYSSAGAMLVRFLTQKEV